MKQLPWILVGVLAAALLFSLFFKGCDGGAGGPGDTVWLPVRVDTIRDQVIAPPVSERLRGAIPHGFRCTARRSLPLLLRSRKPSPTRERLFPIRWRWRHSLRQPTAFLPVRTAWMCLSRSQRRNTARMTTG